MTVQLTTEKEMKVKTVVIYPLCPTKQLKVWQKKAQLFFEKLDKQDCPELFLGLVLFTTFTKGICQYVIKINIFTFETVISLLGNYSENTHPTGHWLICSGYFWIIAFNYEILEKPIFCAYVINWGNYAAGSQ